MHDLNQFRAHLEASAARLADRGFTLDLDAFRAADTRRRAALTEIEQLKARRNAESQSIGMQKKAGADTSALQAEVRSMGERISLLDEQVKGIDEEFRLMLAGIPNLPHASVPVGTSSDDNLEVSK